MGKFIDITGNRYNRLVVLKRAENKGKQTMWECVCDCGERTIVSGGHLKTGHTKQCMVCRYLFKKAPYDTQSRLYSIWLGIKQRTSNTNKKGSHRYVGRGIGVCDEWQSDFMSFYNWSMGNGYEEHLTIDRINNDGNYEPNNCRWTDYSTQNRNHSRNIYIEHNGETKLLNDWCKNGNVSPNTMYYRIKKWGIEKALSTPPQGGGAK